MQQRIEKWVRWLKASERQISNLVVYDHVYSETIEILKANPELSKPSIFYDFLFASYAASAVMGVRRQVKSHKDSYSLRGLLDEIQDNPTLLTRDYYRSLYEDSFHPFPPIIDTEFDHFCASPGAAHIDPALVCSDIASLESAVSKIEPFADKVVAHHDRQEPTQPPNWIDLSNAIKTLEQICLRYRLLLTARGGDSMVPAFQYDWKAIFYTPWIKLEGT